MYLSSIHVSCISLNQKLRDRFMACRTCLREILSRYLHGTAPPEVRLGKQSMGKPMLIDTEQCLSFNVAHTGNTGLIAVSGAAAVGVDIEVKGRNIRNLHSLMRRRFTDREEGELVAMSSDSRGAVQADRLQYNFLRLWTRKEAFVKCTGEGIARGLHSFEVNLDQAVPRILSVNGIAGAASKWSLYDVDVDEDHVAAMVTATSEQAAVLYLDWNSTEGDIIC